MQSELSRVQNERDSLLERFKVSNIYFKEYGTWISVRPLVDSCWIQVTVETANHDKYLFEQKIEDLSNTIKNGRMEKKDMAERMDVLRSRILDLENDLKGLEIGTRQNMSELEVIVRQFYADL